MSTTSDALIQKAARGDRVKAIRDAMKLTQAQFAEVLTRAAKAYRLHDTYDKSKVSKMEKAGREISAEEAAILGAIDPEERGVAWLVFGDLAKKLSGAKFARLAG